MRRLIVFNSVSLDGYFVDARGGMEWAHVPPDPEWQSFVDGNASGGGGLVFGRVTYEMMAAFWPTAQAKAMMPAVAAGMNAATKYVFSRTLRETAWSGTTVLAGDPAVEIPRLKAMPGPGLAILGSGRIVERIAPLGLVDEFQVVVVPVVLGAGRTMFGGQPAPIPLKLLGTRAFPNGNVVLRYAPAG